MHNYSAFLVGNGTMGGRHRSRFESCGVRFTNVLDLDAPQWLESHREHSFEKPDFVVVASPASSHYEYAKFFLERKIPVLVEKPLATTAAEATELVNLSKRNGVLLFVAQSECYNPLFLNFRKSFLGGVRGLTPEEVGRIHLEFRREHGFSSRCRDVDVSLDLLVHDVSLFLNLFGGGNVRVLDAVRNGSDYARVRLQVTSGIYAGVTADLVADRDSSQDIRTITVGWPDSSSYAISLARYTEEGSVAHIPDSLDNEHRFFLKLLAGACKDWAVRAMDNAARAVALAVWSK